MPSKREVGDDLRWANTLPTIKFLIRKKARIILISHLEKGGVHPSMKTVFDKIKRKIRNARFSSGLVGHKTSKEVNSLKPGQILMLENLRWNAGEKKNSPVFAKNLASLADIYINEAFSVSHRRHASIVGLPKYLPSYAGPLFKEEIKNLSLAFNPSNPFMLVVGGNKLATKIPLIKKFFKKADYIIVGGSLARSFIDSKGRGLKTSKILLPRDVTVRRKNRKIVIDTLQLKKEDIIYDLGPKSMKEIAELASKSRFILWNGPLGFVEGGYVSGTLSLIKALRMTKAKVIAGGGDTAAFLQSRRLGKGFHFISTAGGAMLDFLVRGTLPGIEALKK